MSDLKLRGFQSKAGPVWYKVIRGPVFVPGQKGRTVKNLGLAFRTANAPIGYLPFWGVNDFDYSGTTTWAEEWGLTRLMGAGVQSPHRWLVSTTRDDTIFTEGAQGRDARDEIKEQVEDDLRASMMTVGFGSFVDGVMMALGGPAIETLVKTSVASPAGGFIVSEGIEEGVVGMIKEASGLDLLNGKRVR